jgi:hypothetical protein
MQGLLRGVFARWSSESLTISGTKISRYENFTRIPNTLTVFALEIVLGQPASELLAGVYEAIRHAVQERARRG